MKNNLLTTLCIVFAVLGILFALFQPFASDTPSNPSADHARIGGKELGYKLDTSDVYRGDFGDTSWVQREE